MKLFQKIILAGMVLTLLAPFTAFAAGCDRTKSDARVKVMTTIFAPYDFAREVTKGVDGVEIEMLMEPGSESHTFEPTPRDIISLQNSQLFIYTGGENDEWVRTVLAGLENEKLETLLMMDCVTPVKEELTEGMQGEEEESDVEYDQHVWTSLRNAQKIVSAIAAKLAAIDPDYAEVYLANAEAYNGKLAALDARFIGMVNASARKTIVVADQFPLRYFAEDYNLSYYAAFPGCSAETEASAATVAFLANKIKELQIPVVFTIELSNQKIARTVVEGTSAKIETFYTCHNVTANDYKSGRSYYDMMEANLRTLTEALA